MRLLDVHPNIISLSNLWTRDEESELYITMELMDSDLHQIIQSKQNLSEPHHQVRGTNRTHHITHPLALA